MHSDPISASVGRLVFCLVLTTASVAMLCLGTPWLFVLGLVLCWVSLLFSLRPHSGRWEIVSWLSAIAVGAFLFWFSSFGRDPLPWAAALAVGFSAVATELLWWRAARKGSNAA